MRTLFYLFMFMFATGMMSCADRERHSAEYLHARVDTLLEEGRRYEGCRDVRRALLCYWDALDLLEEAQDSVQKLQVYHTLGDLLFRHGVYEKAVVHHREGYELARRMADEALLYEAARRLAADYALMHQTDTADYFLRKSRHIAMRNGLEAGDRLAAGGAEAGHADSIATLYERERILKWEAAYKDQKVQLRNERRKAEAFERLAGFLGVVLMLSLLWFLSYRHKKREVARRERQLRWFNRLLEDTRAELADNQSELFMSRQRICELQQTLADSRESVQENRKLHEELDYYMERETEMFTREKELREREKALLSEDSLQAVALLNRMKTKPAYCPVRSEKEWAVLAAFAELLYPGYSKSAGSGAGLTERERKLHLLVRLGFSTGQLAVFEGISPGSITKAKFRIQKKMEAESRADVRMV
ncbi:MAG: helix-turn-helix transcriptional regulator [Paraprevotella sp.]|nr:helix-turn-helix transcriptional regulator [Paraprevotella sp.]